jgi:hypothetical protein
MNVTVVDAPGFLVRFGFAAAGEGAHGVRNVRRPARSTAAFRGGGYAAARVLETSQQCSAALVPSEPEAGRIYSLCVLHQ